MGGFLDYLDNYEIKSEKPVPPKPKKVVKESQKKVVKKVAKKQPFKIPPKKVIKYPVKETYSHAVDILDGLPDEPVAPPMVEGQSVPIMPPKPQEPDLDTVAGHASALL